MSWRTKQRIQIEAHNRYSDTKIKFSNLQQRTYPNFNFYEPQIGKSKRTHNSALKNSAPLITCRHNRSSTFTLLYKTWPGNNNESPLYWKIRSLRPLHHLVTYLDGATISVRRLSNRQLAFFQLTPKIYYRWNTHIRSRSSPWWTQVHCMNSQSPQITHFLATTWIFDNNTIITRIRRNLKL